MENQRLIIMKTYMQKLTGMASWSLALAGALSLTQFQAAGAGAGSRSAGYGVVTVSDDTNASAIALAGGAPDKPIVIEPFGAGGRLERKEVTWLGAAVEEAPEVLTAQLGLDPGVGLVVTYVATNSPAAKADLQKNDLLVEFEGQSLVHPLQLRKLVQARKEGDTVKLGFYRAGKKHTVSATLAKTVTGFSWPEGAPFGPSFGGGGSFGGSVRPFPDLPPGEAIREQAEKIREAMERLYSDSRVQDELRRSFEQVRRIYEEALRSQTNVNAEVDALRKKLENLARSKVLLDDKAAITVKSTGRSAKSLVKADDSGTIVLVKNPKLHLTAHDQDGKLLFDGEIETSQQRDQVPRELWNKVEPLLKKMTSEDEAQPDAKPVSPKETASPPDNGSSL
jgi:Spy/CpxP family protein refolding chaperone